MFFWNGRMVDAHNGFRQLILKHHTPQKDGKPVTLPLTAHSINSDVWCAYQFDRKDLNLGAVFAFRRKESPFPVGQFKLQGLEAHAKYECTDIDSDNKQQFTGRELMETGVEIKMPTAPCSAIITYRRTDWRSC